jgi:hypothetical protein
MPARLPNYRARVARSIATATWSIVGLLALTADCGAAETRRWPLTLPDGLRLLDVTAESARLDGQKGLRVVVPAELRARIRGMDNAERQRAAQAGELPRQLAVIEGFEFGDGAIDVDLAGEPLPDAPADARGFVGIAFRVQKDGRSYDAFYLRPTNGRADDQLRRNHAAQYISHPDWPWSRLRDESPGKYESYVDLEPGKWTHIRIEVRGVQARLYVHGAAQPTLIVNDLKTGADALGAIALWVELDTLAHFRNLSVTRTR